MLRRDERSGSDEFCTIGWQDRSGASHQQRARIVEKSQSGARLEVAEPIEVLTRIYITTGGFGETASVRHCTRQGMKFRIGVEFNEVRSR